MSKIEETNSILRPQSQIESQILWHPDVFEGLWWGKPRQGHSEGEVIHHVAHILNNINRLTSLEIKGTNRIHRASIDRGSKEWFDLRLIAILHDTFKYQVDRNQSRDGENHHAMRARRFAEKHYPQYFTEQMLDVLELHDEAYNSWCKGSRDGKWDKAETRALKLFRRLGFNIDFYTKFYACDTHIGDTDRPDFKWFLRIRQKNTSDFMPL